MPQFTRFNIQWLHQDLRLRRQGSERENQVLHLPSFPREGMRAGVLIQHEFTLQRKEARPPS